MNIVGLNQEQTGLVYFLVYWAIGFPIALLHIRQQRMTESVKQCHDKVQSGIVGILATMWPVLLFSMALLYWQKKRERASKREEYSLPSDKEVVELPE